MRAGPTVQIPKLALLAFGQRLPARRFVHLSLENREKSRSVVLTVAPVRARCGEDGVHDQRTGSLSVANETAQDVPVPFARVERVAISGAIFDGLASLARSVNAEDYALKS